MVVQIPNPAKPAKSHSRFEAFCAHLEVERHRLGKVCLELLDLADGTVEALELGEEVEDAAVAVQRDVERA